VAERLLALVSRLKPLAADLSLPGQTDSVNQGSGSGGWDRPDVRWYKRW